MNPAMWGVTTTLSLHNSCKILWHRGQCLEKPKRFQHQTLTSGVALQPDTFSAPLIGISNRSGGENVCVCVCVRSVFVKELLWIKLLTRVEEMLTGDLHWHHYDCCLVSCCHNNDVALWPRFAILGIRIFVIDGIIYPCQNSQTHLFSWALRSCELWPCQLLQIYPCLQTVLCECMCVFVCVCVCACAQPLLRASLHGMWLPALSMSEVWARLSMLPLAVRGTSLVCCSPTGWGLAAHQLSLLNTNLCHLHPLWSLFCSL